MGIENPTLDEAIAHCRERLTRYHCDNHPTAPIPVYQQHLTVLLAAVDSKPAAKGQRVDTKEQ